MLRNTEIKLLKEKDNWIYRLRDKRAKLSVRLSDCLSRVAEFKLRDKIFEAEQINGELKEISLEINEFNKEVLTTFLYFIKCIFLDILMFFL